MLISFNNAVKSEPINIDNAPASKLIQGLFLFSEVRYTIQKFASNNSIDNVEFQFIPFKISSDEKNNNRLITIL